MKRHIQKTGVRKFFGQDFIDLQTEPLAVLDGFFAEYGACVIEGCAITEADGGTFDVASGLVAIEATDPESGAVSIRTMPFEGVEGVALPLYLSAEWVVVERAYGDGKVKPIAYNLRAVASGIKPSKAYLMLTAAGGDRFVDVVQDGTHRFVSDSERAKWNDILRQAKEYAALQTEAAKRSAIEHTDAVAVAVRDELVVGDAATLVGAKQYADRIVAALVDSSPEALNTLQELAAALGNNPNFATDVLQAIGERATITAVNSALASKFDKTGGTLEGGYSSRIGAMTLGCGMDGWGSRNYIMYSYEGGIENTELCVIGGAENLPKLKLRANGEMIWAGKTVFHSGNIDKVKLDAMPTKIIRGSVDAGGGNIGGNANGTGFIYDEEAVVRITHNLNTMSYSATATSVSNTNAPHSDNVVSVWRKGVNYVDFVVTCGPDNEREMCAFDYIIIPY